MTRISTVTVGTILTVVAFAAAAALYDRLPAEIPTHWGLHGEVNGTLDKPWGAFLYPAMIGLATLLAVVLPAVSPERFRIEPFAPAFRLVMAALIVFLACLTASIFSVALGLALPLHRIVPGGTGILLIVIGNVLGKTTPNFFIGIRTPWTLANAEVWSRTHRLAGRLFVAGGLILASAVAVGFDPLIPTIIAVALGLFPAAYSWRLYRQVREAME